MDLDKQNEELIKNLISRGALKTERIIEAFRKVKRHNFVPEKYLHVAYVDAPLPLEESSRSTISQPYTVAVMVEALQPKEGEKILDVGTGSGWQTCLLSYCVGEKGKIVTMEINEQIYNFARKNIEKFNFKNIIQILGDGSKGHKNEAPYDKIIITAAARKLPENLKKQLKVGGRIVVPIGGTFEQQMIILDKISENKFKERSIGYFIFVPLIEKKN